MLFVKTVVFRCIKFINSDEMFRRAFQLVIRNENSPPSKHFGFQQMYESAFKYALNTWRSSCDQTWGMILRKTLTKFQECGEAFFTMERNVGSDKLKQKGNVMHSTGSLNILEMCTWSKVLECCKESHFGMGGTDATGDKLVTKSEEAFGLLLIDNYMEKWKTAPTEDVDASSENAEDNNNKAKGHVEKIAGRRGRRKIIGNYKAKQSCQT